jgi:SAM-dependent MidA family methyltransferase
MAEALYGPRGFYTVAGRAGRRADFLTSPEVGPLFGTVISRWIDAEFRRIGEPDDFTVVEVGAGPGTLARSVLAAAPQWTDRYVCVELSEAQRASHPAGVASTDRMPTGVAGVVIANELLDNLPFRLAVFDGGWREAYVVEQADGAFVEVLRPAPSEWSAILPARAVHGGRAPIQQTARQWVDSAVASLRVGTVLCIDYCTATTAEVAAMPWRDWLRTYRAHERGGHYLRDVGLQDITAQVCLDQLPEPFAVRDQAQFLMRWGIDDLVEEGRRVWEAAAARPDVAALRMRSRLREAEALCDRSGLGSFVVSEFRQEA